MALLIKIELLWWLRMTVQKTWICWLLPPYVPLLTVLPKCCQELCCRLWVLNSHLEGKLATPSWRHISNWGILAAISVSKHCSFPAGLEVCSRLLMERENQGEKKIHLTRMSCWLAIHYGCIFFFYPRTPSRWSVAHFLFKILSLNYCSSMKRAHRLHSSETRFEVPFSGNKWRQ